MKLSRVTLICLSFLLVASLACGCSTNNGEANPSNASESLSAIQTHKTAEDIVNDLKDAGMPVGNVVVYDKQSDPNGLLGSPNEYTGKADFVDLNLEQPNPNYPDGGTVEIFKNSDDAQARYEYVSDLASQASDSQYIYVSGNALLRLDSQISPDDAAKYQSAFEQAVREG